MKNLTEARRLLELINEIESNPKSHLSNIDRDLEENNIDYCIIGGAALPIYNYSRYTEDIDLLVSKKGFDILKKVLIGSGYTFRPGSKKNLYYHSATKKIPIDILLEGDDNNGFILPNPTEVRQRLGGCWYLSLPQLITFKLISYKSGKDRGRDKQDVLMLIKNNKLDKSYSKKLPKNVREDFISCFE